MILLEVLSNQHLLTALENVQAWLNTNCKGVQHEYFARVHLPITDINLKFFNGIGDQVWELHIVNEEIGERRLYQLGMVVPGIRIFRVMDKSTVDINVNEARPSHIKNLQDVLKRMV